VAWTTDANIIILLTFFGFKNGHWILNEVKQGEKDNSIPALSIKILYIVKGSWELSHPPNEVPSEYINSVIFTPFMYRNNLCLQQINSSLSINYHQSGHCRTNVL